MSTKKLKSIIDQIITEKIPRPGKHCADLWWQAQKEFASEYKLTRQPFGVNTLLRTLPGNARQCYQHRPDYRVIDHSESYAFRGRPFCIVSHSYIPLREIQPYMDQITATGLQVFDPQLPSWRSGHNATALIIARENSAASDYWKVWDTKKAMRRVA